MDGLLVVVTSLCSGGVVCLVELYVNSVRKKKEERCLYRRKVTQKYCDFLYDSYRIFRVPMEILFNGSIAVNVNEVIEEAKNVYYNMLELDTYYEIYKGVLDEEETVKKGHKKLQEWIFKTMKPAIDSGDEEKIQEVFVTFYNDIQYVIEEIAQVLVKKVMKYYEE